MNQQDKIATSLCKLTVLAAVAWLFQQYSRTNEIECMQYDYLYKDAKLPELYLVSCPFKSHPAVLAGIRVRMIDLDNIVRGGMTG
jgi:hypothetical protein